MEVYHTFVRLCKENQVSIVLFLFYINHFVYSTGFMNLILQKTCFPEGPPGTNEVCNNSEALKEYNTLHSVKVTWRDALSGFLVFLAGSWRDQTGLSLPLALMAVMGEILGASMTLISSLMWHFSAWSSVITETLSGLMGSRVLFTVASVSYVTDHSPVEERAIKVVVVMVAITGGTCVGSAIGGFLLSALNYTWLMCMVITIYLLVLALSFHAYQEEEPRNPGARIKPIDLLRRLKVVFLPRQNFLVSWVLLFSSFALTGLTSAEGSITYSYFQKVLFLNPESAGVLQSYRLFTSLIMSIIATPLLIARLKLTEFKVSIISAIPIVICCFCMAFVSSLTLAYIFYTFDLMRIALISLFWTILSKSVRKTETGIYVSFLIFGDAVSPLIINPLYVLIFNATIDDFPGAFFIVSGFITLAITVLLIISSYRFEEIKENSKKKTAEKGKDECKTKSREVSASADLSHTV